MRVAALLTALAIDLIRPGSSQRPAILLSSRPEIPPAHAHAQRAQALLIDHDRRDVFGAFLLQGGALLLGGGDDHLPADDLCGGMRLSEHVAFGIGNRCPHVGDGAKLPGISCKVGRSMKSVSLRCSASCPAM